MIFPKIEDFINNPYCLRENTSQPILACEKNVCFLKLYKVSEKPKKSLVEKALGDQGLRRPNMSFRSHYELMFHLWAGPIL